MRKTSFIRRVFGCLLGLLCFVATRSQSAYAYSGRNKQIIQQKILENSDKSDENVQKQTLFNVLKELNKTRGVYFLFSEQSLGSKLVNPMEGHNVNVEKVLDQVLKNTGLKFKKINDKTFVILSRNNGGTSLEPKPVNFAQNFSGAQIMDEINNQIPATIITGKVTAADGTPVAGVSVTVKGSKRGTSTNAGGVFSIEANKGDILIFSYVGYATQEAKVGDNNTLQITLAENNKQLNEVVVTALGIKQKTKDLTYATQRLSNSDLTTVKDANFVNSLTGKVAGVTINRSASGLGGSARVVLRGNKSTRENQPLYVIDGIPLANFNPAQPSDVWGQTTATANSMAVATGSGGRDGGDGISNMNPDDIESVVVLKGASGAALYGSAAANGVIVITTKSGKVGKARIAASSDLTFESPLYHPDLQFKYGQTGMGTAGYKPASESSWGPVVNAPDNTKGFFQTGVTSTSSISLSGGTDKAQTYFSYGFTDNKGIMLESDFKKHNFNFRETAKFLDDRLTVDANLSFLTQQANNRPGAGLYANPLTGLYIFPRGLNFDQYKTGYQYFSASRNVNMQNWFDLRNDVPPGADALNGQDHEQNPYWLIYKAPKTDSRDRGYGNLTMKYKLNDWLSVQARGNFDKSIDTYNSMMAAGTQSVQAASNGRYTYDRAINTQVYGDFIVTANKQLSDNFHLQANVGTSISDTKLNDQLYDTDPNDATGGLAFANKFGISYILPSALITTGTDWHKEQQGVFASTQLGFKEFLFLDLTGRNDWSSNFAYTPTANKGYFYYSAGLNLILSDALRLPTAVSFGKVRLSYARVGNDVPPYATNAPQFNYDNRRGAALNTKVPYPGTYLQPEDNRSFEVGTEWRFLRDRVGIDLTYYKNNNYKQYMEINVPEGTGKSVYYLNLGNIQNTGVEATAFIVPVSTRKLKWTSTFNFAANKNTVIKLSDANIPGAVPGNTLYLSAAGVNMYASAIKEGGSWGDIYGFTFARNPKDGSIMVDGTGAPQKNPDMGPIGNPNPKFSLGWNNSFDIQNFTVNFLIDGRFGGKVMSVTQAELDGFGDTKVTASARNAGGVNVKATNITTGAAWSGLIPAQTWYGGVGGRAGLSEYYMYSATVVRLRELAVGYKLPVHVKGITDLRFSLIGRNLFFLHKDAPFDPEISMATNNGLQGVETFGIPSTRSIGASVKIGF